MRTTQQTRPNIVFILSDDQGTWSMGCAGNREIETPNLDRLAATGLRFENFFCASPVCSPARATLLTGRIPSQHGVHDWLAAGNTIARYEPARNGELIEYLENQPGYTDLLAATGYHCGISGKWHLGDAHHAQKGFEYWAVHAKGGGPYYHAPMLKEGTVYEAPGYVTDVITDNALQWLESVQDAREPFYLSVHYTAPHSPWSRDDHPTDLYDQYYQECAFTSVPDQQNPPDWVRHLAIPVETSSRRREYLSGYFAAVTAMDRNIGRLIDWLETSGLRQNTLIVFTSDNGMNMGHHGVYGKGNATFPLNVFEESIQVPFIASQPGRIPADRVSRDLVSQYDVLPTLLEYVGIGPPATADPLPGKSFASSLLGAACDPNDHIVVFDEYGPVRLIRSDRWKYVRRFRWGPDELYDLHNDPGERRNLAGTSACRAIEHELQQQLSDWFARYVDPDRDGFRERVTGKGQLGLGGQYAGGREAFSCSGVQSIIEGE